LYPLESTDESLPATVTAPHAVIDHPEWILGSMVGRSAVMQRHFSQMRGTGKASAHRNRRR